MRLPLVAPLGQSQVVGVAKSQSIGNNGPGERFERPIPGSEPDVCLACWDLRRGIFGSMQEQSAVLRHREIPLSHYSNAENVPCGDSLRTDRSQQLPHNPHYLACVIFRMKRRKTYWRWMQSGANPSPGPIPCYQGLIRGFFMDFAENALALSVNPLVNPGDFSRLPLD
jgi:hypothetical protein